MVSRIELGPDGGPYVELDEDAGDLVIRVPNDTVDFDSNDLLNAVLQNATMDGGSLDGVSLASALDANNQDLNSVGTASVASLEAEVVKSPPRYVSLRASSQRTIPSGTFTRPNLEDTTGSNSELDFTVDESNDEVSISEEGAYLVTCGVRWSSDTDWSTGDQIICRPFVDGSQIVSGNDRKVGTEVQQISTYPRLINIPANTSRTFHMELFQESGDGKEYDVGSGAGSKLLFEIIKVNQ